MPKVMLKFAFVFSVPRFGGQDTGWDAPARPWTSPSFSPSIDAKAGEVQDELRVAVRFVACIEMYVSPPLSARPKASSFERGLTSIVRVPILIYTVCALILALAEH
jgi:hypothetical protein